MEHDAKHASVAASPLFGGVPILSARGIVKEFTATRALDGVDVDLLPGHVLGLVGENGAGKSTLMKILAGIEAPTRGELRIDGKPATLRSPADAQRLGIAMIHQELNLVDDLTVADNIFLGRERTRPGALRPFIDAARTHDESARWLAELSADIDPGALVRRLSIAEKQLVEIAKALSCSARVLIMDEPTAVLTAKETTALLALIRRLRERGVAIVYISHLLGEVLAVCDRISVLRDGRVVAQTTPRELGAGHAGEAKLAGLMVGREMKDHFPARVAPGSDVVMRVSGISVEDRVYNASFELRDREILGLAGLVGAGRTELCEAIVGLRRWRASAGERGAPGGVVLHGESIHPRNPREAANAGIAYLSEDRKGAGLVLGMGVAENTTLANLCEFGRVFVNRRREDHATREHVTSLAIRVSRIRDNVATLSGGNQQKVALAKWLRPRPRVLILDEPTRGVDIGAKEEIYKLIQRLTAEGMACLVVSSEINELLGLCHRIAVVRRGRIVATLDAAASTEEDIMYHAAGVGEGAGTA